MNSNRVLFVVGMHRSGTSAFAGSAMLLGGARPRAMMEAGKGNPKGHFESHSVVAANDAVLASLGRVWFDFRPLPELAMDQNEIAVDNFAEILKNDFEGDEILILKDPRISLLSQQWIAAAERAGTEPLFAILLRPAAASASSVVRRDNLRFSDSVAIWLRYMLDIERGTRGFARVFVQAEDFVCNPVETLADVSRSLNFEWPHDPVSAQAELNAFVDKDLFHPVSDDKSGLLALAQEAYSWFLAPEGEPKFDALDLIRAEFDAKTPDLYSAMVLRELQLSLPTRWEFERLIQIDVARSIEIQRLRDYEAIAAVEIQGLREREAIAAAEIQSLTEREAIAAAEIQVLRERGVIASAEIQYIKNVLTRNLHKPWLPVKDAVNRRLAHFAAGLVKPFSKYHARRFKNSAHKRDPRRYL